MGEPIRVLLVDDEPLVVDAIHALLAKEPHITVVGAALTRAAALHQAQQGNRVLILRLRSTSAANMGQKLHDFVPLCQVSSESIQQIFEC
jgi:DNA-binding NarL/FixJ family response regulator